MKVRRFEARDRDAIARLNARLRAGGAIDVVYPEGKEQHRPGPTRERLFVAEDGDEIRGGVWLREQLFRVGGQDVTCGWLKYPVAESLVNPAYSGVPGSLLVQCLREQPLLFALGLGGHHTPLARMLTALRWTGVTVPLFVYVVHPSRVLRQLAPFRATFAQRVLMNVLAYSGLGWLGARTLRLALRARGHKSRRGGRHYQVQRCETLGGWADDIWTRVRDEYQFIAHRTALAVDSLLPQSEEIHRLRVTRGDRDVGWVTVLRHDCSVGEPDATFGRLTVGLIADGLAAPDDAHGMVAVALEFLESTGVDIVVSNQLHPAWVDAFASEGFVTGPSNVAFYASPKGTQLCKDWRTQAHISRGDCDGPVWYER